MKNSCFLFLFLLSASLQSCKKDDVSVLSIDLGVFQGNIQVVDDPQTKLGYIYNAKVSVTVLGADATIKITGDNGFDREYTGSYSSQVKGTSNIVLKSQKKPSEKIIGGNVIIFDNKLTVDISIANDNVSVKANPAATQTIQIVGKLRMIGTDLLKQ